MIDSRRKPSMLASYKNVWIDGPRLHDLASIGGLDREQRDEIRAIFRLMALRQSDYAGLPLTDDLIEPIVDHCAKRIDTFDPKCGFAFNYFTQIVVNEIRKVKGLPDGKAWNAGKLATG
jgi:hypothetical protein